MNNRRKIIITSISIFLSAIICITGTYAWFKWRTTTEQTVNINLTATSVITFVGGQDVTGYLVPAYVASNGTSKNIRITSELPGSTFNLYFKIKSLPEELQEDFFLWAIYKGNQYIDGGNFETYNVNDNIPVLLNRSISADSYDTYTLYFWLDAAEDYDSTIANKTVSLSLYATGESGIVNELDT